MVPILEAKDALNSMYGRGKVYHNNEPYKPVYIDTDSIDLISDMGFICHVAEQLGEYDDNNRG